MKRILIVKTGTVFPAIASRHGDFEDWTAKGLGLSRERIEVVSAFDGHRMPDPSRFAGVVITGSYAMVSDREPWSEKTAEWIREAVGRRVPLLGICYGHQLLAHALGGTVGYHPKGREIGTVEVQFHSDHERDLLLKHMPDRILVHAAHLQTVLNLPEESCLLASNDFEPHQAFRIGECAWGTQFHPEFTAEIMRSCINEVADSLREEGFDPQGLGNGIRETPLANSVLRRFADLAFSLTESRTGVLN